MSKTDNQDYHAAVDTAYVAYKAVLANINERHDRAMLDLLESHRMNYQKQDDDYGRRLLAADKEKKRLLAKIDETYLQEAPE